MSSALACIGLAVRDEAEFSWLLKSACMAIREISTFDGVHVGQWLDDSGAALILGLHDGELVDFSLTYNGASDGLFADCRLLHESIAPAKVVDAASSASQIHPSPESAPEPPAHYDGPWPPRLAAESFISHGLFADIAQNRSRACLSGTVLHARHHVCVLTGQPFTTAAVRTAGFSTDLCLGAGEHPNMPVPGNIISGTVFLSAAIDAPYLNGASA